MAFYSVCLLNNVVSLSFFPTKGIFSNQKLFFKNFVNWFHRLTKHIRKKSYSAPYNGWMMILCGSRPNKHMHTHATCSAPRWGEKSRMLFGFGCQSQEGDWLESPDSREIPLLLPCHLWLNQSSQRNPLPYTAVWIGNPSFKCGPFISLIQRVIVFILHN